MAKKRHTFAVKALKSMEENGDRTYVLAARAGRPGQPRKMSYGGAVNISAKEALYIKRLFAKTGLPTRIEKSTQRRASVLSMLKRKK